MSDDVAATQDECLRTFRTAYSPMYESTVEVVRVFRGTRNEVLLLCSIDTDDGSVLMVTFRPTELQDFKR